MADQGASRNPGSRHRRNLPNFLGRLRLDAVRAVGMGSGAYIMVFVMRFARQGAYLTTLSQPPIGILALAASLSILVLAILASQRNLAMLSWLASGMVAFQLFPLPAMVVEELIGILTISLGLGIPFLLLLEVILTMEGGTAKSRVVFRGVPLVEAILITLAIFVALTVSFSYVGMLSEYARSPEAATFQAAMMGGLTLMVFGWILLSRPRRAEVRG